jgi:hypothetical protein
MDYIYINNKYDNSVTLVTAFFDINRAEKGDGRTIDEYKEWIMKTLKLNCNLCVITEQKFLNFFIENRSHEYNIYIKIIKFTDLYYYKYYDKMKEILSDQNYRNKISYPNRVECILPEYNIIQYSKFHCLEIAINKNPFNNEYFLWIDAGISRFFLDVDLIKPYPGPYGLHILKQNKFVIQKRHDLEYYNLDNNFIWKADNLLSGGMFGGNKDIIKNINHLIENKIEYMINNNNINNEQIALALIWKDNKHLFFLTDNYNYHLMLFKILSN